MSGHKNNKIYVLKIIRTTTVNTEICEMDRFILW